MKSIIEIDKKDNTLEVDLYSTFNLRVKNILENQLEPHITRLYLDLSQSNRIDSEGIIFLHHWQQSGKELEIVHPPSLLFVILDILEISESWDLKNIITQ
jgi:ABC-type transporter Mla MlaB component